MTWRIEHYTRFPSRPGADFRDWVDVYYRGRRVLHLETFWTVFTVFMGTLAAIAWWNVRS